MSGECPGTHGGVSLVESSTACLPGCVLGGWVIGLTLVGGWLDTLLGPEGSAVRLMLVGPAPVCGGWFPGVGRVGLLVPPFVWCPRLRGCWVLVGLLFEICIVDASIFVASPALLVG